MNNLNSNLIEGTIKGKPIKHTDADGAVTCTFDIISKREGFRYNGKPYREDSRFSVLAEGKLADAVFDKGKNGRGVRVVGRLRSEDCPDDDERLPSRVVTVAEHIEIRPEFKKRLSTKKEE